MGKTSHYFTKVKKSLNPLNPYHCGARVGKRGGKKEKKKRGEKSRGDKKRRKREESVLDSI